MKVPHLFTAKNKYPLGVFFLAVLLAPYLYINQTITNPAPLPLTWVDRNTPFVAFTVWIYMSYFMTFVLAFILEEDLERLNRYCLAEFLLTSISNIIFVLYPTIYERNEVQLTGVDPLTTGLFELLYSLDKPVNCLPSLHVSSSYLAAFIWFNHRPKRFWCFLLWATAIAISTLTTKQHYLVDVWAGLGLAALVYVLLFRQWHRKNYCS